MFVGTTFSQFDSRDLYHGNSLFVFGTGWGHMFSGILVCGLLAESRLRLDSLSWPPPLLFGGLLSSVPHSSDLGHSETTSPPCPLSPARSRTGKSHSVAAFKLCSSFLESSIITLAPATCTPPRFRQLSDVWRSRSFVLKVYLSCPNPIFCSRFCTSRCRCHASSFFSPTNFRVW